MTTIYSIVSDYLNVRNMLSGFYKKAQNVSDPELASPDIKIEPMESSIQKAVDLLKNINPNYFVGVRKIVLDTGSAYGFVEGGGEKDPTIIHINLPKIKSEIQNKLGSTPKEEQDRELVRQIALTLSHERAHALSFKAETGFQGGEAPAESEEQAVISKIDTYLK